MLTVLRQVALGYLFTQVAGGALADSIGGKLTISMVPPALACIVLLRLVALNGALCVVHCVLYVVYCVVCTVRYVLYAVCCVLYDVHFSLFIARCALWTL